MGKQRNGLFIHMDGDPTFQKRKRILSKDIHPSASLATAKTAAVEQAEPQGIGMAVAFDWGLAVQILATPFVSLFFGSGSFLKFLKLNLALTTLISFLLALPFATLLAIFGEGVRRGWRWTRPVQMVSNGLLFFLGINSLVSLIKGSQQGNYWGVVPSVILLVFSPLIAWRMSRSGTKRWFATTTSGDETHKRHGGAWPWLIALWSIVGGVLQTIAAAAG